MCIHDMVTTTNTRKPVLEKTKTKKDKAVLHHISAFKEKDRSGVSKRFIFLIFLIFFFSTVWLSSFHMAFRDQIPGLLHGISTI